jgi:hypothetical protein
MKAATDIWVPYVDAHICEWAGTEGAQLFGPVALLLAQTVDSTLIFLFFFYFNFLILDFKFNFKFNHV